MRVELEWADRRLEVEVAAENVVTVRRAEIAPALSDPAAAVRNALEEPVDFPPLRRALTPDDQIVIVVDERVPQLPRLLVPILEHIASAGVPAEAVTLLCLPPSSGQPWLEDVPDTFAEVRVEVHQPADRRKLAYLATTKQGRRVYLNRSAVDADQLILLTRRTYDPLLGRAGAEGALFPGLSDQATQQDLATHLHGGAPGREPWAINREAAEIAWLLGAPFFVHVIEGSGDAIVHVVAGPAASSGEAERLLDARWRVGAAQAADLVVGGLASGSPITAEDIARAFFTAARVVKRGGRIVMLTDAAPALGRGIELIGQRDDAVAGLHLLMKERPADMAAGFMWATAAQHARLYLLSGLPPDLVEGLFTTPLTRDTEVQRLFAGESTCLFLPDAHKTLATVEAIR